ncbi:hypothetical protein FN846DRAFT_950418 [Sphaerosporella brunnea]|uniref:Uncharacterized protein n=1 Tax=Sphaerosporella brunnea TaxID=1250544 RepID=A0A5J5EX68_9PEZI|nr:hypothetical protein FN846DRAFT_950418 [Sphaerosporella brunnea]
MAAFNKSFLFALLLIVAMLFLATSVSAQTATVGRNNTATATNSSLPGSNATASSHPTGADEASAGTTISSSVALFGALIAVRGTFLSSTLISKSMPKANKTLSLGRVILSVITCA